MIRVGRRNTLQNPLQKAEQSLTYEQVITGVRANVEQHTPVNSIVAVINKGDPQLLHFPGRQGWHFPRREDGQFIGHHPKDAQAAVDYLFAIRRAGANFLVVPETYSWWLDHYPQFRQELESTSPLAHHNSACRIYSLSSVAATPRRDALRYQSIVHQIREVVDALLPRTAKVAVASKGDPSLLQLHGRKTFHFPRTESGQYLGHHPADDDSAVNQAIAVHSAGAEFLVFPKPSLWWLDHYSGLARYLKQQTRCVARQDHVCWIFEWQDNAPAR